MIDGVIELMRKGGVVMIPIVLLSCLLYERCFHLLLYVARAHRWLKGRAGAEIVDRSVLQARQAEVEHTYSNLRRWISVLIAAAPLLGLLGTVMGMVSTFESLSLRDTSGSVEGLARGISIALITTEAGLAIAIPGVLLIYYAERQLQKGLQEFARIDARLLARHQLP